MNRTWCIVISRVKNTVYKQLSLEEYTRQEKYCDERFLGYNGDMSINFLSILCDIRTTFATLLINEGEI